MNQCIRLTQSLVTVSNFRPVDEVKLTSVGIISILGNLRSVYLETKWKKKFNLYQINTKYYLKKGLSNYLNKRETYLDSDYLISTAPAPTYDTDLENYWTQSSKTYFPHYKSLKIKYYSKLNINKKKTLSAWMTK